MTHQFFDEENDMEQTAKTAVLTNSQNRAGKYLTFILDNEEYGLEILKVREIIGYM